MAEQKENLKQSLSVVHIFAITSGSMISSGLFVLPGMAHARAGPAVILSYFFAGLLAAVGTVSIAELSTAMPKAGGDYFFIMRSFGPGVGSVTGLLSWFSLSLKSAFAIVGMTTFIALISDIHGMTAGVFLCVLFVIINLTGVHQAARLQIMLVFGLYALLSIYIVAALPRVQPDLLVPFVPHGWGSVFTTSGFVFVAYGGLLKAAGVAEETRNPGRTISLGMILSLITTTLFYTLVTGVTSGLLPGRELNGSLTPISDGGRCLLGDAGFIAMSIAAILAFISTANAGIMSASRYLLALSRDNLLPEKFSHINARFATPHAAVITTGIAITVSLFMPLDLLVKAASTVLILAFIMSCLSVIILRQSGIHNYRPKFKAPFYPWIQIAGIAGFIFLLLEMGWSAYLMSAGLIFSGVLIYWFYGRRFVEQEYALLHVIESLTDRTLVTGSLENELKEIIRQRDQIVSDQIDCIIEEAPVLDAEGHLTLDKFLQAAAKKLAGKLHMKEETLIDLLKKRESKAGTVLDQSLAVPHIVIPGKKKFALLLARARQGIAFSGQAQNVTAIFVVAGTADERSTHLRMLAALVEVFQSKKFLKRWMKATNDQALRDILLLAERRRGRKSRCPSAGSETAGE